MRWLLLLVAACKQAPPAEPCPHPVLIVTAMQDEMAPIAARMQHGNACVRLAVVGVGPQLATRYAEQALAAGDVSAIVMAGIAGGVARDVRVGDVTVPARWSRHDRAEHWLDADRALLAHAAAAHPALRGCHDTSVCGAEPRILLGGNGVTGAWFVAEPAAADDLAHRLAAQVTDMETAAVAEVAQRRGVPFVAVRAVSDLVWTGHSRDLIAAYDELAADNAAAVTEALLRSP